MILAPFRGGSGSAYVTDVEKTAGHLKTTLRCGVLWLLFYSFRVGVGSHGSLPETSLIEAFYYAFQYKGQVILDRNISLFGDWMDDLMYVRGQNGQGQE